MLRLFTVLFLTLTVFSQQFINSAHADEVYTFVVKKQEQKKATRWSLGEWLETRDRMRLMDLWLALHTPTPYEFYLDGSAQILKSTTYGNATATAYATIFGLQAERNGYLDRWMGLFHFRIFGYHAQGTNITLLGGLRSQKEPTEVRGGTVGASMNFYLHKFLGLEGRYLHFYKGNSSGNSLVGHQLYGHLFLDFSFIRLYGGLTQEYSPALGTQNGSDVGLRLFF